MALRIDYLDKGKRILAVPCLISAQEAQTLAKELLGRLGADAAEFRDESDNDALIATVTRDA